MHRDLPPRYRGSRCHLYAPPSSLTFTVPPSPPLRKRRLPLPTGSRPYDRRCCPYWWQPWPLGPPLVSAALQSAIPVGVALQVAVPTGDCRPFGLAAAGRPFASGRAVAGRPCTGPSRGQPPL
ncbi:hypothetical protein BHE74_00045830 [Ensete ventricosum]|nr:hypothetical protein BHE74_00045830 [Ensete ventricosum]